jgi:hypothetical protein
MVHGQGLGFFENYFKDKYEECVKGLFFGMTALNCDKQ